MDGDATEEHQSGPRVTPPEPGPRDVAVDDPPESIRPQTNTIIRLLPVVTALATVAAMLAAYAARSAVARSPMFVVLPAMMLVSAIATAVAGTDRSRGEIARRRADYFDHLADVRSELRNAASRQHDSILWDHPDPDTLWTLVGGPRMWERVPDDADFCRIRVGRGESVATARVTTRSGASSRRFDPVSAAALRSLIDTYARLPGIPLVTQLAGSLTVHGDAERARALVRAIICGLAVSHPPSAIAVAAAADDVTEWDWLKWLPHNRHPCAVDDVGGARLIYSTVSQARAVFAEASMPPRIVVVVDTADGEPDCRVAGLTILRILAGSGEPVTVEADTDAVGVDQPDQLSRAAATVCARRLARFRTRSARAPSGPTWPMLTGVSPDRFDPATHRRSGALRAPIGVTPSGVTVELDLNEAAMNGMGPHGLCIGATGSGKSEFLRMLVLGLMVDHRADDLNLVLVDFKGGATFAGLESAPHVAALITNLSDSAALVARMRDALLGELNRRQEALRAAGNLDGVRAYRQRHRTTPTLDPMPTLLVVVDEFSELLTQQPDFAEVFVAIGRLGRSLGIHLLLASQRLDEARLRGLESHLSYRVCLKTLSASESRTVLGSSAAYELPNTPGAGYLRTATGDPLRFQAAFVSARTTPPDTAVRRDVSAAPVVRPFTGVPVGPVVRDQRHDAGPDDGPSILDVVVQRLSADGPRARGIWLPPLEQSPALATVLAEAGPVPLLTAPIGVVDRPFEQRRTPLRVDLRGAAGNVAVVGAPQSGKSTTLRTLVEALAAGRDPRCLQFYCLDFGGGGLSALQTLSHVGTVTGRTDPERVRRTIARIGALIRTRETLFQRHGVESVDDYRRRLLDHDDPVGDGFGEVFLVIDGWPGLQRELDTAEASVTALAAEGLSFGVHVVVAASRWAEIRPALRDQLGTRIELRLGDPSDSELDRRRAHDVPEGRPGRGLTGEGLHMVVAQPMSADEHADADRAVWRAPAIPVLPQLVEHDTIATGSCVVLGVDEDELQTAAFDFGEHRHLLILGDSECGKTATLRTVCRELRRTGTVTELIVVDPRRGLLGAVDPYATYLTGADTIGVTTTRLVAALRGRMPNDTVTAAQLRDRSWWSGPDIYVIVDDYDALGTGGAQALAPLAEMVAHSRDIGLHLLLARRAVGAARAMYDPLLAAMRDDGCATLLMSAYLDDGLSVGPVRPTLLPPGRGALITRRGDARYIQVGWSPES